MTTLRRPQAIKCEIEEILSTLIERGIIDDQNFPVLRRLSAGQWEVSFDGAEHVSLAIGGIDYDNIYRELSEKRSYNAKLLDGGLLQLMYLFQEERLVRHRLAFYPAPDLRPFREDPEVYMCDELYVDIVSRHIVPFPIRFDFDESAAVEVIHPHCHLTLGDVERCRIPVSTPLTPRWFIEFILRYFYQTDKYDFVTELPHHRLQFDTTVTMKERSLIHILVPSKV